MSIAETFFGGTKAVQARLAQAIVEQRGGLNITNDQLDTECGFGTAAFPEKSAQFEADPTKLTGRAFGMASVVLNINLDDVLKVQLNEKQRMAVVEQMKTEAVRVTAACGGGDVSRVELEEQVPVFILLKTIEELG
jgi:hypothetical protein